MSYHSKTDDKSLYIQVVLVPELQEVALAMVVAMAMAVAMAVVKAVVKAEEVKELETMELPRRVQPCLHQSELIECGM